MLTRKQHELLMFINGHLEATGFSPSFDEMKAALALKSKSGIHRLITALEERGFLRRRAHRARALEVVKLPQIVLPSVQEASESKPPNVLHGHFGRPPRQEKPSAIALPLFGRIAAGSPIEALHDQGQAVDVPTTMLSGGEHYALEVAGDSMIDAGIMDGDTVVIRRGDAAENGDIVVALVDESEVTLKRLRRRGNSIALEPANRNHEIRIFGPDRVQVQGKLVGLLRVY